MTSVGLPGVVPIPFARRNNCRTMPYASELTIGQWSCVKWVNRSGWVTGIMGQYPWPTDARVKLQEAPLSQRGCAMLRVCIASIQNVERSLLLLVVSASYIPLRTIKFFSVLFSSAYSYMLQSVTNIRWCVADCAIYTVHCMVVGNCFCHFVVRTSRQSIDSQWCVAHCVIYSASSSVNVFGTSHVQQSSIASY